MKEAEQRSDSEPLTGSQRTGHERAVDFNGVKTADMLHRWRWFRNNIKPSP